MLGEFDGDGADDVVLDGGVLDVEVVGVAAQLAISGASISARTAGRKWILTISWFSFTYQK